MNKQKISQKEAELILEQAVYNACLIIEQMENEGRTYGNGHHARQKVAVIAKNELQSRWLPEKENGCTE